MNPDTAFFVGVMLGTIIATIVTNFLRDRM